MERKSKFVMNNKIGCRKKIKIIFHEFTKKKQNSTEQHCRVNLDESGMEICEDGCSRVRWRK